MSIKRGKRPERHFSITNNSLIRDPSMSLQAKMLLIIMLSYPDDWEFSLTHLTTLSTNGLSATRAAFNELEECAYVKRTRDRDAQGRMTGWSYEVCDEADMRFSDVGFSDVGEPHATKTERPTKTEITKTEVQDLSSAAPTFARPGPTDLDLLMIWNDNRGSLPQAMRVNGNRASAFKKLRRELGDDTAAAFQAAVRAVAGNAFWVERGYGLDNLLRGRVLGYAEQYANNRNMTTGDRRLASTATDIANALENE